MPALSATGRVLLVALAAAATPGCVSSYTSALGYRARQAADQRDVAAFDELMEEAADTTPAGPLDNPRRTVLSHFLALGASDRFFPMIEAWRAKGWVSDTMTCAIHRARWRGVSEVDAAEADRAADVCLERARAAAADPDRRWELEACLAEAPFLTQTSTRAVVRYVDLAADLAEPFAFRAAVLDGLTTVFLQDPGILRVNEPSLSKEAALERSHAQLREAAARFDWIVARVRRTTEPALLGGGTSVGALELERVSLAHGETFIGRYARSRSPEDVDLAWAWVRSAKAKKRLVRHDGLGVLDRNREPAGDAFWYVCAGAPRPVEGAERVVAEAVSVLATQPLEGPAEALARECKSPEGAPLGAPLGPFPLEITARAAAAAALSSAAGRTVELKLVGRASHRGPVAAGQAGPLGPTVTSTAAAPRAE